MAFRAVVSVPFITILSFSFDVFILYYPCNFIFPYGSVFVALLVLEFE